MKKRVIAINLPQFHPFKENDEWWGKGFTEWTNVVKAKPLFKGHHQPHLPTDTGFYDLRLPEARQLQAEMAKESGIYGFCYYHYWFNGKRLMERPVNEILRTKNPDFPFMLCWANENWTRTWDGLENNILMKQDYTREDSLMHIHYLMDEVFSDNRYIKIDGKPVFAIYRCMSIPDIKEVLRIWREEARKRGMELYLCAFESFGVVGANYNEIGFDAWIDFPPHSIDRSYPFGDLRDRINWRLLPWIKRFIPSSQIFPYSRYIKQIKESSIPSYKRFPAITPRWDNTARKKVGFFTMYGSTPELYYEGLSTILHRFTPYSKDENLVFINAWNEWAEGNHLEPDTVWGRQYLDATLKAIEEDNQ